MKKSEWSDKQLEDLLRQMPKIKDNRHPRDIYQNISLKKKRKRGSWLLPGAATAAALLLLIILVPKLMVGSDASLDRSMEEKSSVQQNMITSEDNKALSMDKQEAAKGNEETIEGQPKVLNHNQKNGLYEDEIGNGKVLTYWIPDQGSQILVPISTVVDQGNGDVDGHWFDILTQKMDNLKEEEWGLSNYYPLNARVVFQPEENRVLVDVPSNHTYGQGSANERMFIGALTKTIASNSDVKEIMLTTNGKDGIEFGNSGPLTKFEVKQEKKHAYFFLTPEDMEIPFIVPSWESYSDIESALESMRTDQTELGLTASLTTSIPYESIAVENNKLVISFDQNAKMNDDRDALNSFEAILLTAKDFELESVVLVNAPIKQLGPFDLTKEIKVPVGANFKPIE